MSYVRENIPPDAVGLRLARIDRNDDVVLCDAMRFDDGWDGVEIVLRRAAISGRVEVDGEIQNHFADLLDENQGIVGTVALDAGSYKALKTKWMRCKVDPRL